MVSGNRPQYVPALAGLFGLDGVPVFRVISCCVFRWLWRRGPGMDGRRVAVCVIVICFATSFAGGMRQPARCRGAVPDAAGGARGRIGVGPDGGVGLQVADAVPSEALGQVAVDLSEATKAVV